MLNGGTQAMIQLVNPLEVGLNSGEWRIPIQTVLELLERPSQLPLDNLQQAIKLLVQLREIKTQVNLIRRGKLSGCCGGGCTQVRYKIGNGEIGFVTDTRDNGHG